MEREKLAAMAKRGDHKKTGAFDIDFEIEPDLMKVRPDHSCVMHSMAFTVSP